MGQLFRGGGSSALHGVLPVQGSTRLVSPRRKSGRFIPTENTILGYRFTDGSLDPIIGTAPLTFTRASIGTYYNNQGLIREAPINVPRFDYNPTTLQPRGLLIEESRTNFQLRSEQIDLGASSWQGLLVTTTLGTGGLSPNGTTQADTMVAANSTGLQSLLTSVGIRPTMTVGESIAVSIFVKAGTYNLCQMLANTAVNATAYANFNVTNGTVTQSADCVAKIEKLPNGWFRCSITYVATATDVGGILCSFIESETALRLAEFTGTGTETLNVFGGQIEVSAAAPGSYIKTGTSSVTRAFDLCQTTDMAWFTATEGTLYSDGELMTVQPDIQRLSTITEGADLYALDHAGAGLSSWLGVVAASTEWNIGRAGAFTDAPFRMAGAYAINDQASATNGVLDGSAIGSALLAAPTALTIGSDSLGAKSLNGWVGVFAFNDVREPDTFLAQVTSP